MLTLDDIAENWLRQARELSLPEQVGRGIMAVNRQPLAHAIRRLQGHSVLL